MHSDKQETPKSEFSSVKELFDARWKEVARSNNRDSGLSAVKESKRGGRGPVFITEQEVSDREEEVRGLLDLDHPPKPAKSHLIPVISPRNPAKVKWDLGVGVLIVYSVMLLPFRIGFEQESTGAAFVIDCIIDVCFFIDMVLCFHTGFFTGQDWFISDSKAIAVKYLSSYFLPDLLSTLPFDILVGLTTQADPTDVRSIKLVRIVRLIRLVKFMRLLKLGRSSTAFSEYMFVNAAVLRLFKLIFKILFLAHLLSCFWYGLSTPICRDNRLPGQPCSDEDRVDPPNWVVYFNVDRLSLFSRYVVSFHWVTKTMMAVGYGDIFATNEKERLFTIMTQIVGAASFGFILSAVTELFEDSSSVEEERKKHLSQITNWLEDRDLPNGLSKKIRSHYEYYLENKSVFDEVDFVGNLPLNIKGHIAETAHWNWYKRVKHVFPQESRQLLSDICLHLKPQQVPGGETILEPGEQHRQVYIVLWGHVEGCLDMQARKTLNTMPNLASYCPAAATVNPHKEVLVAMYGPGEEFGCQRTDLLRYRVHFQPRLDHCDLVTIDKDSLHVVFRAFPGAEARYEASVAQHQKALEEVLQSDLAENHEKFEDQTVLMSILWKGTCMSSSEVPSLNNSRLSQFSVASRMAKNSAVHNEDSISSGSQKKFGSKTSKGHNDDQEESPTPALSASGPVLTRSLSSGAELHSETDIHTLVQVKGLEGWKIKEGHETEQEILRRFIVPPQHRYKLVWDISLGVCIFYSVVIIPYRIGFSQDPDEFSAALDIVIDILFFLDMAMNFRTGYPNRDGVLITVPFMIRRQYLKTWFFIDFFSTFPIDRIMEAVLVGDAAGGNVRAVKLIRIIRLVRLLKLARLLKMGKLMDNLEEVIPNAEMLMKSVKLGFQLIFLAHLLGCFWFWVSATVDLTLDSCTTGALGCSPDNLATTWWLELGYSTEKNMADTYVAAFYWAFTTMTTVGYGDICPTSDAERIYAIACMIGGATVFGYVIGSLSSLAKADDAVEALARQKRIEAYFEDLALPEHIREALKNHFYFFYQERSIHTEAQILAELPNHLRKAAIYYLHSHLIKTIGLFPLSKYPDWFICNVVRMLEPQSRMPHELIILVDSHVQEAYFVVEGECEGYDSEGRPGASTDIRNEDGSPSLWDTDRLQAVYTPGCVFGVEGLVEGLMRLSVRAGEEGSGLYVLTQAATSELAFSQPEVFSALQYAVADMVAEQVASARTTQDVEAMKNKLRLRDEKHHLMGEPGMQLPAPAEPLGQPPPAG